MSLRPRLVTPVLLLLVACTVRPTLPDYPLLQAPAVQAYVEQLLCRLNANCRWYPVLLVDRPEAQAELLPDGRLALHRGMLQVTANEAELAFVLAHEVAHRERQHRPTRSLAARLPLELEADAEAQRRLCTLGYPADAGRRLLERLRPGTPGNAREAEALKQIDERLSVLGDCPRPDTTPVEPLLGEAAFAEMRASLRGP